MLLLDIPTGLSQHISLDTQHRGIGDRVSFTVRIDGVPNAVNAFGFDVTYDRNVLQYRDTFVPEELGRHFEFLGANELHAGRLRVGGLTTQNPLATGSFGRLVTLEFTVIGPGNATLSLANLVDDFTEWPVQSGSFEGMASQPPGTPTESSAPQPSSVQIGSGTLQPPRTPAGDNTTQPLTTQRDSGIPQSSRIPIGGSSSQPSSTPREGDTSQPSTAQTTGMTPQPPGTQPVRKSAESMRTPGASISSIQEPRYPPTDGKIKTSSPTAGGPVRSPKTTVAEQKKGGVSGGEGSVQPLSPTPETATASHDAASQPATAKATGSDGENLGVRYGASPVNALFSGAAFIGVIFTILLQRRELKLQREELKLMRLELSHMAKMQDRIGRGF